MHECQYLCISLGRERVCSILFKPRQVAQHCTSGVSGLCGSLLSLSGALVFSVGAFPLPTCATPRPALGPTVTSAFAFRSLGPALTLPVLILHLLLVRVLEGLAVAAVPVEGGLSLVSGLTPFRDTSKLLPSTPLPLSGQFLPPQSLPLQGGSPNLRLSTQLNCDIYKHHIIYKIKSTWPSQQSLWHY